ncbi:MAG: DUF3473 domain-containing protein [Bacilli bacterium]
MNKIAVFTMDVESFYDTTCNKDINRIYNNKYSFEEYLQDYLSLLKKNHIKCTLFLVLSSLNKTKDILKNAIKDGNEIALHGYEHISPIHLKEKEFIDQTKAAKETIEKELDTKIIGYRAPCFGINNRIMENIKSLGFTYDASVMNFNLGRDSSYCDLKDFTKINSTIYKQKDFYEFKISTTTAFKHVIPISGGGYLRMPPFFIVKHYIKKYLKNNDSFVFYCHPFEIAKAKIPWNKKLNFYENLYCTKRHKTFLKRIKKIITLLEKNNYSFYTFEELTKLY